MISPYDQKPPRPPSDVKYTRDDLVPGESYSAPNQGMAITPRTVRVKVVSLHGEDIWYEKPPFRQVHITTIERFLQIINGEPH